MNNRPPNTRVQKTRASPSALRSPPTRRPLGRASGCIALIVVLLGARCSSQPPHSQPLDLHGAGLESLSGDWNGSFEVRKAGSCTVQGQNEAVTPFHCRVTIRADGGFDVRGYEPDGSQSKAPAAIGVVDASFRVTALRAYQADCPSGPSDTKTQLLGQIAEEPEGTVLEMAGLDEACPKSGCAFRLRYRLVRSHQ